jgi:hypothetical protein
MPQAGLPKAGKLHGATSGEEKEMKATQRVFEAKFEVPVDDKTETVTQLFAAKDFQAAFFKARAFLKSDCPNGVLVNISRQDNIVI